MKLHELKLLEQYAKAKKKDGIKPFEIRKNDRDFKVGDLVKYNIVESYTEPYPPNRTLTRESSNKDLCKYFDDRVFKIKYITDYEQKENYIVFTDELIIPEVHKQTEVGKQMSSEDAIGWLIVFSILSGKMDN